LKKASVLPLAGPWRLRQLISAVETYRELGQLESLYPVSPFEDVVMAAVWLGDVGRASAAVAQYEVVSAAWPEYILAHRGGHRAWIEGLQRLTENPEALREAAESHIKTLKLAHLPRVEMLA
jgi:hypothetical protein